MSITRTRSAGGPRWKASGGGGARRTVPRTHSGTSGAANGSADPVARHHPPAGDHRAGAEALDVLEHRQVGAVARRDRAQVAQPVVAGGMQRRHEQRVLRRHPLRHRLTAHRVEVPLAHERVGLPVVRAERAVLGAVAAHELQQRAEVARVGRLAEQDPQPAPALLQRLLPGGRLVVGADARRGVGVELPAGHPRRMAVDVRVQGDLGQHGRVPGDHRREVHHLRDAQRPAAGEDARHLPCAERPLRRLQRAGRHAGGGHHVHAQRQVAGGVEHPVRAVRAEHVGHLVRVAHHRGRAARDDDARELGGQELGGLEVDVRVDHPRDDGAARRLDPLAALVAPDAGDPAAGHGHVALQPLAREGGEHPPAGHHEVGLRVAAGHGQEVGPVLAHA